ncbi:MAG: glycerophosphodiester phosphodiesterase family protein [bacterium]
MSKLIKIVNIFLISTILIYLIFTFLFGGFGISHAKDLALARGDSMLLFAHRGILNYFPEHSMDGANEARQLGFNAIEIDIRKSADDEYVIFHDETAERLLGIKATVNTLNLSVLKKNPLLFNNQKTLNYVFTVDEFLNSYKNDFVIYFDMKLFRFSEADKIISIIKKHSGEKTCIIASADIFLILYIELKHPEMLTALEGFDSGKEWTYRFIPKNLRPDYLSGFFQNIDANQVDWLKKMNLLSSRIVYGIVKSNYDSAKAFGIKNIILDYDSSFGDIRNEIRPRH